LIPSVLPAASFILFLKTSKPFTKSVGAAPLKLFKYLSNSASKSAIVFSLVVLPLAPTSTLL